MASSWKSLSGVPSFTPDTMLLMTDASVLIHDTGGKDWYRMRPDGNGRYDTAGVTWSGPFLMTNTRQFYASGVLKDGRVFALGGEYSDAGNDTPLGEIFDPQTNAWSPMSKPSSFNWIHGDVSACIMADGRVLFGALTSNRTAIWDPAVDTWIEAGLAFGTLASPTKVGVIDEETWSLLQDGTVLTVDISSPPFAEKYNPVTDTWVAADQSPGTLTHQLALLSLTDTTVSPPVQVNIGEIGPAILLPDGRLFFIGATGHTALYNPPPVASQTGFWTAGPDLPPDTSGKNFNSPNGNIQTAIDAPAALLPDGRVLLVCGQTVREVNSGQTQFWSNPSTVCIYDPVTNGLTPLGSQPPSNSVDTWQSRMLLLPNGQIAMTTQQSQKIAVLVDATVIRNTRAGLETGQYCIHTSDGARASLQDLGHTDQRSVSSVLLWRRRTNGNQLSVGALYQQEHERGFLLPHLRFFYFFIDTGRDRSEHPCRRARLYRPGRLHNSVGRQWHRVRSRRCEHRGCDAGDRG